MLSRLRFRLLLALQRLADRLRAETFDRRLAGGTRTTVVVDRSCYFFYGIFTEPDMLSHVLGKEPASFEPAVALDLQRFQQQSHGLFYAELKPGSTVSGVLVTGLDAEAVQTLDRIEGVDWGHYRKGLVRVRRLDGRIVRANVYLQGQRVAAAVA